MTTSPSAVFDDLESNVRSYCRRWPAVFARSHGSYVISEDGVAYLDFFAGAGALSYGHNNPRFVDVAIAHLQSGRLLHSLDTFTPEKREWLETLHSFILKPRGLDMVVQTVGPTGATAVEAALQLAQRVTGKRGVIGYEGGYHGMTYRAASVSASLAPREVVSHVGDFVALEYVEALRDSDIDVLDAALRHGVQGEGIGAILLEPVQGEGGARPFDPAYLKVVGELARTYGAIVIADEVQAGVGRTGTFFSFEGSGLSPDIICVSKSISGLGLPMALNLVRRDIDAWSPGEFTGTFRGNNLAFATSSAMLHAYWATDKFAHSVVEKGELVHQRLSLLAREYGKGTFEARGKGLLRGLYVGDTALADRIASAAFREQLIVETCGEGDQTVKLLMPLTTSVDDVVAGLDRLEKVVARAARW